MPLFALPIAESSTAQHSRPNTSRVIFSSLPTRKRKRNSPVASSDSENSSLEDNPVASTNPLSLAPEEIAQYQLAGLNLDEELPSVKNFPHRPLPPEFSSHHRKGKARQSTVDSSDEQESKHDEQVKRPSRGPQLRIQHIGVLTTLLQRCLLEGDIPRASRAWSMLIRMQVSGRGMDLRSTGYWGIGAELLIRSLDRARKPSYNSDSDNEEYIPQDGPRRWGTKEGLEKAKDYYERLILHHPYKRQFHGSVSALDFWPAMVGCEIYGIQFEQKESLRRLDKEEEMDDNDGASTSESENSEESEGEDLFTADHRRLLQRRKRRAEKRWQEREDVRQTALTASEKITSRLDELMQTPPYSDSHNLLRLRGMLALYIGDLSIPSLPIEDDEDGESDDVSIERNRRLGKIDRATERRFLYRKRLADHERGKQKQKQEQERARQLFYRITREGGPASDIKDVPLDVGEPEEVDDTKEA